MRGSIESLHPCRQLGSGNGVALVVAVFGGGGGVFGYLLSLWGTGQHSTMSLCALMEHNLSSISLLLSPDLLLLYPCFYLAFSLTLSLSLYRPLVATL